ncbi:bacteriocin-like protein [Chryseobacterium fluminis]
MNNFKKMSRTELKD